LKNGRHLELAETNEGGGLGELAHKVYAELGVPETAGFIWPRTEVLSNKRRFQGGEPGFLRQNDGVPTTKKINRAC